MGGSVRGEVESKADGRGRWRQTRFNSNGVMGIRSATTPKDSAEWGQFIILINAKVTKKKEEGGRESYHARLSARYKGHRELQST